MEKFCFVVEKIEWDHDTDGLHYGSEDHHICRVCLDYEDAKSFVEQNAEVNNAGVEMRWHGDRCYSGSYEEGGMRYGLVYELHYVALC